MTDTLPDTSQNAPYQLLPPLSDDERAQLKDDIRRRGVAVPVEMDEDGNILDGHHRVELWGELRDEGVDVPQYDMVIRRGMSEDDKKDYVLALNLKRRHLDATQKAYLFARLRKPPFNMTLQQIADVANVGVGTVWRHIDGLPDDVKAELETISAVGSDGKAYPAKYLPRLLVSAEKIERDFAATGYTAGDQTAEIETKYLIIMQCSSEEQQATVLAWLGEQQEAGEIEDDIEFKAVMS